MRCTHVVVTVFACRQGQQNTSDNHETIHYDDPWQRPQVNSTSTVHIQPINFTYLAIRLPRKLCA